MAEATELYLAIDSGGTKVQALLYDAQFRLVAAARSGSLRANTTPAELVEAHFEAMLAGLGLRGGERLARIGGTFERAIGERLKQRFDIGTLKINGELDMGLSAAELFGDGILALSGTGATLFGRVGGRLFSVGGYGAAVSDEGSGYWISRNALLAAIRDFEGRGERTALTALIAQKFGGCAADSGENWPVEGQPCESGDEDGLRARLRQAIFNIYADNTVSPVARVASLVPLVTEAAARGDNAAVSILSEAGSLMGEQAVALIRCNQVAPSVPIAISGSVWRKNPIFYNAFMETLHRAFPGAAVIIPRYEPVIGVLLRHMYETHSGFYGDRAADFPAHEYDMFAFSVD